MATRRSRPGLFDDRIRADGYEIVTRAISVNRRDDGAGRRSHGAVEKRVAGIPHPAIKRRTELFEDVSVGRVGREIALFEGVVNEVIQLFTGPWGIKKPHGAEHSLGMAGVHVGCDGKGSGGIRAYVFVGRRPDGADGVISGVEGHFVKRGVMEGVRIASDKRHKAHALHAVRHLQAGQFQESRHDIDVGSLRRDTEAREATFGERHDKGGFHARVKKRGFGSRHGDTVVGGENHDGAFGEAGVVKRAEDVSDGGVNAFDEDVEVGDILPDGRFVGQVREGGDGVDGRIAVRIGAVRLGEADACEEGFRRAGTEEFVQHGEDESAGVAVFGVPVNFAITEGRRVGAFVLETEEVGGIAARGEHGREKRDGGVQREAAMDKTDETVAVGPATGNNAPAARTALRSSTEVVFEQDGPPGEAVEFRGADVAAVTTQMPARIVGYDEQDVGPGGHVDRSFRRVLAKGNRIMEREQNSTDRARKE